MLGEGFAGDELVPPAPRGEKKLRAGGIGLDPRAEAAHEVLDLVVKDAVVVLGPDRQAVLAAHSQLARTS